MWAKRMAVSDDRADHAEGMATAMDVSVKQLQAQLALRQQELAARDGEQQGRLARATTSGQAEPPTWLNHLPEPPVAVVCTQRRDVFVCAPVLVLLTRRGGGKAADDAGACSTDGGRRCRRSKGLDGLPEQAGACMVSFFQDLLQPLAGVTHTSIEWCPPQ